MRFVPFCIYAYVLVNFLFYAFQVTGIIFSVIKMTQLQSRLSLFNYPPEFLIGISGSYSSSRTSAGQQTVSSITFSTTNKTYRPFGRPGEKDRAFEYQLGRENAFGGFHGTTGTYLNSIGAYLKLATSLCCVALLVDTYLESMQCVSNSHHPMDSPNIITVQRVLLTSRLMILGNATLYFSYSRNWGIHSPQECVQCPTTSITTLH